MSSAPPSARAYWRRNLVYLFVLLSIWFLVSFGCGIIFVEELNRFYLPGTGFKLGFWFAQQGSIYVFCFLILVYVFLMGRLDRKHGVEED
ncbi:MAG: putative solute:sodium symporter small subunit [Planctomycetota bacterium]|jgi:putative solute:sodium symporter small subunit